MWVGDWCVRGRWRECQSRGLHWGEGLGRTLSSCAPSQTRPHLFTSLPHSSVIILWALWLLFPSAYRPLVPVLPCLLKARGACRAESRFVGILFQVSIPLHSRGV